MFDIVSRHRTLLPVIGLCLIVSTAPALGASLESGEKWEVDLELHIWAALPGGTTTGGGGLDFDISELKAPNFDIISRILREKVEK